MALSLILTLKLTPTPILTLFSCFMLFLASPFDKIPVADFPHSAFYNCPSFATPHTSNVITMSLIELLQRDAYYIAIHISALLLLSHNAMKLSGILDQDGAVDTGHRTSGSLQLCSKIIYNILILPKFLQSSFKCVSGVSRNNPVR